jgi:hypothetical protein
MQLSLLILASTNARMVFWAIVRRCSGVSFLILVFGVAFALLQPSEPTGVVALLAPLLWPFYKTMEVSGPFPLVFVNPALENQFANLGQASAFLLGNLQKGSFNLAGDSESDLFVFDSHNLRGF